MKSYYVYILTNKIKTVLYIGVTNDLQRRVYEHKNKLIDWFTKKYNCDSLLYYEQTWDIESAIMREKELKWWSRKKKDNMINSVNEDRKEIDIM